jgi:homoserine acetyltransferase
MADEYGEMTAEGDTFVEHNFVLENGTILPEAQLRYQTYGTLNEKRDNVLVVCHASDGECIVAFVVGRITRPEQGL